jgi:transposase InsO family protein
VVLAAENLFLRKQLVLYRARPVKLRRASDAMRLALVLWARCCAWREALTLVQPAPLIRGHRQAFRLLSVCVALAVGRRWRVPVNVPSHSTAAWTLPPFQEILAAPHAYRVVLHARDGIYAPGLDAAVAARGVRGLRTPVQAPQANAYCERRLGRLRRECLDFLIPLNEDHLRRILGAWRLHYNRGRTPASLGPGLPQPPPGRPAFLMTGHQLPRDARVVARSILGGLHHE